MLFRYADPRATHFLRDVIHLRGELIALFDIVLPTEFAYYLVYPQGREDDLNIVTFRQWLLAEAERPASPEPRVEG